MKRILSMVIAATFVLSCFGSVGFAGSEEKVFYSNDYQGENPTEDLSVYEKTNKITVEKDGDNKYLKLLMTDFENSKDCFINLNVKDPTNNMVFAFDVRSMSSVSGNFMVRDTENVSNNLLVFENGQVKDASGNAIFEMKSKWVHVEIAADFEKQKADYYIDGKKKASNVSMANAMGKFSYCRMYIAGKDSELDVDNWQVYEGNEPREVEFIHEESVIKAFVKDAEGDAGENIYYNRTYDEEGMNKADSSISLVPKTNIAEFLSEKGNTFLKLESKMTQEELNDCFADIKIISPKRFLVMEACYSINEPGVVANLINLKDQENKQKAILTAKASGEVTYAPLGQVIGSLENGKWLKVAVVLDTQTNYTDLYVNDKFIDGGLLIDSKENFGTPSVFRIYLSRNKESYGKCLYIDNIRIYEGKIPREIKEGELPPRRSVIPTTDDAALSIIKKMGSDAVLLNVGAQTIFHHGQKSVLDVGAFIKNGRTLVPVRAVSEAFGARVEWDEVTRTVTVNNSAKIVINSSNMILPDGSSYTLDVPAEIANDRTMLPLRALCEKILGKAVTWNDRGLIIVADNEFEGNDSDFLEVNNYMVFERPDAAAIDAAFKAASPSHPRIYTDAAGFAKIKASYSTNENMKTWIDGVIKTADKNVNGNVLPKYEIPDGKRLLGQSSTASGIFESCGFAYIMTKDKKYVDHSWKAIQSIAAFPDWNPSHYLDVGEMTYGVAIAYDWMYDAWTPEQRKFIEETLYKYSLSVTDQAYYGQNSYNWWVMVEHNWNPWINGSITCGALAVYEAYPELCSDLISKAVRCQESMLRSFYPDGAWMEGISYWAGTARFIARMVDSLNTSLKTDFNLTKAPAMSKMGYYALNACGPTGYSNPYHDTSNNSRNNSPVIFWVAREYNDPDLARIRLKQMQDFNFSGSLLDILWFDLDTQPAKINLPLDAYYRDVELVSMRGAWDAKSAAYVSFHGGDTVVNHHHVDTGNYVIDMLGERFVDDLGSETYSVIEHGTGQRYDYYRVRTEGHNLYVINPSEDVGQLYKNVFAPVEKMESSQRSAYSVLNMTQSYANEATSARRGYMLGDDRRSVTVRDEFDLKNESEVYWFVHTAADVEILDDTSAKLTINGKSVKATVLSNTGAKLEVMDAVPLSTSKNPTQNVNTGYKKLMLHFKKSGDVNITIKYVPFDSALADKPVEDIAIDQWKNEEGELREIPLLDMISVNGNEIGDFEPGTLSYKIRLPWDAASIPVVSAAAKEGYKVEITQSDSFDKPAKIKVYYADDDSLSATYSVNFAVAVTLGDLDAQTRRLQVNNIVASENPQPENLDINVSDADLLTRWSASGDGQWIYLDLGSVQKVDGVCIAVMNGTTRKSYFSIEVSADGENWTTAVEKTETSGTTDEPEKYWFASPVQAQFVRYTGFGNSVNAWNSVTEFGAIQKKSITK